MSANPNKAREIFVAAVKMAPDQWDAYLSEAWVSLSETKSRHLKAYGPVPKKLAEYLDPRLDELNAALKEIRQAAESATSKTPREG